MRGYEYQARTTRERPHKLKGNALAVCEYGTAVPETNQRSMGEDLSRSTGKQTVKVGR